MGILSSIFRHKHKKATSDNSVDDNPWAGLSSYEDPEEAEREGRKPKQFRGRDEESRSVAQLIIGNIFVTLYGKSGTGKTSLLNAGVFPMLRQKRFLPVCIRLAMEAPDDSFQQCIIRKLAQAVTDHQCSLETINVVEMPEDEQKPDYLWSYFARTRFVNSEGQTVFPVLVFDQFEEIFLDRIHEAEVLLRQIAYLMDESHALSPRLIDGRLYTYDFNFRFVISIREDELYRLEDSIDNCYLPALKRCRYRLRGLMEQGAMDVILVTGEGLFKAEEQQDIAKSIIDKSRNKDKSINTNIVSLLCNRIFVVYRRSGAKQITHKLVDSIIKGNTFEQFNNEASEEKKDYKFFAFISYKREDEKLAKWLQNKLEHYHLPTTLNGKELPKNLRPIFRDIDNLAAGKLPVQISRALKDSKNLIVVCSPRSAKSKWVKKEIEEFIKIKGGKADNIFPFIIEGVPNSKDEDKECFPEALRSLPKSEEILGGNINETGGKNVALVKVVAGMLGVRIDDLWNRYEKEEKKNRWIRYGVQSVIIIFAIFLVLYFCRLNYQMSLNMSRVLAEKALTLVDEGDSYTARLLALEALPTKRSFILEALPTYRPYTVEAEISLRKACSVNTAILKGHTYSVNSASFSPDGKQIVSASADSTVRIWDAETGECLQILVGHTGSVYSASFSPDGKWVVSASEDNTDRIWDVHTGQCLQMKEEHTDDVNSASYSSDGKRIVSATWHNTIYILDAKTGQCLQTLKGHTSGVESATFSPDGKRIVSASSDKTVRIWNVETGQCLQTLEGHKWVINSASFSPDSKLIVSASEDYTVRIWDAYTGQCLQTLEGHTSGVKSATFSPDGKRIVSASYDKTVRIWDAQHVQCLQTLNGHIDLVRSASFSPDGKRIVSASNDKTVRIWDSLTGQCQQTLVGHSNLVSSTSFSPDGRRIVSASNDSTACIWDAQTGQLIQTLRGHKGKVESASFCPDGNRIVSASEDSTIRIWDANNGQCLHVLEGHKKYVRSAFYSPDSRCIISASLNKTVCIWDAEAGKLLKTLEGHTERVLFATFSPDSKRIVSASDDKTIRIWDAQTGQCLQTLEGHTSGVNSASFSPDGKLIVSSSWDKTVRIWDSETGQCLQMLEGHTDDVNSVSFSPDGKRIVSASNDGTIRIWEFPPLQELIENTRERFKNRPLTPEERKKYYLD